MKVAILETVARPAIWPMSSATILRCSESSLARALKSRASMSRMASSRTGCARALLIPARRLACTTRCRRSNPLQQISNCTRRRRQQDGRHLFWSPGDGRGASAVIEEKSDKGWGAGRTAIQSSTPNRRSTASGRSRVRVAPGPVGGAAAEHRHRRCVRLQLLAALAGLNRLASDVPDFHPDFRPASPGADRAALRRRARSATRQSHRSTDQRQCPRRRVDS